MPQNAGLPIGTANFDLKARTAYAEYYHAHNAWYERGWKKGFPAVVLSEELLRTQDLMRSEWSDFCKLTGMFEMIGAHCLITHERVGTIGIHRPRGARPFNESDRRLMMGLLPHLQRLFQLQERLGMAAARTHLAMGLWSSLSIGLALVGADSRLLFASSVAENVLRQEHYLAVREGRLCAAQVRNGPSLERLIMTAVRTSGGWWVVLEVRSNSKAVMALWCF
ncbi:hypothetical protein THIX_100015 [Thiomonas sp. X19]|nr:hypothetical protein THIX_100015 [Thiomonas sp. X19]